MGKSIPMAQEMVSQPTPREPTLIDYARYHGIAYDHRLATPPLDNLPPLLPPPSDEEDEPNSRTSYSSEEKLEVPRQAVRWFGRICHQLSAQPDEEWDHESLEYRRWITRTKLEPPALESDHQWDVVEFRQKHDISLDMLEGAEPDEDALGYTEAERERSEQLADDVENEKLQIPRAAFGWLQSLVKDFRLDYRLEVEDFHKAYAKVRCLLSTIRRTAL